MHVAATTAIHFSKGKFISFECKNRVSFVALESEIIPKKIFLISVTVLKSTTRKEMNGV